MTSSSFLKLISYLKEVNLKKRIFFVSNDDEGRHLLRYKRRVNVQLPDYLGHLKLKYKDNLNEIAQLENEIMPDFNSYYMLQFNMLKYFTNGKLEYNDNIELVLADYIKLLAFNENENSFDTFLESTYGKHCTTFIEKLNVLLFDIYNKRIQQNIDVCEINTSGTVEEVLYSYFLNFGISLFDTVNLGKNPRVTAYDVDICIIYQLDIYIVYWKLKKMFEYFFDYLLGRVGYDHDKHILINHLFSQYASSYTLDLLVNSYSYFITRSMISTGWDYKNLDDLDKADNVFMKCEEHARLNIYNDLNFHFKSEIMVGKNSVPFKLLKGILPIVGRYKCEFCRYVIENSYQREYVIHEGRFIYPIKESDVTLDYIKEISKSISYAPYRSARYLEECTVRANVEAALPEKITSSILYNLGIYPTSWTSE